MLVLFSDDDPVQAFTRLTLELSAANLLPDQSLDVTGKLTRLPDTGVSLAGRTLVLEVSDADGVVTERIVTETRDAFGQFRVDAVGGFARKGAFTVTVTFEATAFLAETQLQKERCQAIQWHMEAEWALLWTVGKVEALGLPTQSCDSRRLVDEIVPPLGSDIAVFINGATLRSPGELLADDDRTYDLWCRYHLAKRNNEAVPEDLNYWVLYERRYAFEWLDGNQEWDEVTCDT